jgi:hypothetical protein
MFTFGDMAARLKLGEFLLCEVGASSDSGLGKEDDLIGEVPFWMRRG